MAFHFSSTDFTTIFNVPLPSNTSKANNGKLSILCLLRFFGCVSTIFLRDIAITLLRKPPAMRCKAEFSHRTRRHASRTESIPQCKCRFPHKFNTPEYLPIPYLRHPPHQPPIGDRPRKCLISEGNPAPSVIRCAFYNPCAYRIKIHVATANREISPFFY